MMKFLHKTVIGIATVLAFTVTSSAWAASEKYIIDKEHTAIVFLIKHAGFSSTIGQFRKFDGYIEFDREHPEKSILHVNIDPKSIQTPSDVLDDKLRGEKYFDTKKHPNIHFSSKTIKVTGEKTADITGNLQMHGAIHPVTLKVTMNKDGDFFGTPRIGFSARGQLKRSDFGINEAIPLVSDEVELIIESEAVKVVERQ